MLDLVREYKEHEQEILAHPVMTKRLNPHWDFFDRIKWALAELCSNKYNFVTDIEWFALEEGKDYCCLSVFWSHELPVELGLYIPADYEVPLGLPRFFTGERALRDALDALWEVITYNENLNRLRKLVNF